MMRSAASPFKGCFILLHGHGVEFNGTHQRGLFERYPAFLPGITHHQRVGVDAVSHQGDGGGVGIESGDPLFANHLNHFGHTLIGWVLPIAVLHKCSRRRTA